MKNKIKDTKAIWYAVDVKMHTLNVHRSDGVHLFSWRKIFIVLARDVDNAYDLAWRSAKRQSKNQYGEANSFYDAPVEIVDHHEIGKFLKSGAMIWEEIIDP